VIIVLFANRGERSVVCNSASVSTSTAAVASSRTRMLDGARSARAKETSCRCPWERLEPLFEERMLVMLLLR
jgi:hypothetical protein